eukprot:gene18345-45038_t
MFPEERRRKQLMMPTLVCVSLCVLVYCDHATAGMSRVTAGLDAFGVGMLTPGLFTTVLTGCVLWSRSLPLRWLEALAVNIVRGTVVWVAVSCSENAARYGLWDLPFVKPVSLALAKYDLTAAEGTLRATAGRLPDATPHPDGVLLGVAEELRKAYDELI